ncbi:Transposable element Tc3 transposase [Folsomia candida]|uniref:Transposable element Tc3 transposase n=1 Tax=Folsomia candida TaxID=158441 RepID=A0A226E9M0_FOLCA|nr:Transposable element Tc3 transposase [Folsomia candida]
MGLVDEAMCRCGRGPETVFHFLGSCDKYCAPRLELFGRHDLPPEQIVTMPLPDLIQLIIRSGRFVDQVRSVNRESHNSAHHQPISWSEMLVLAKVPTGKPLTDTSWGRLTFYVSKRRLNRKFLNFSGVLRVLFQTISIQKPTKDLKPVRLVVQGPSHLEMSEKLGNSPQQGSTRSEKFRIAFQCLKRHRTQRHKDARLEFARTHMSWEKEWQKVVFTDEKKFNLDGPDGYSYYWHHLKKQQEIFSKRQAGGGSVMLWGGFGYNGKTELASIPPRTDSLGYQEVLKANLLREGPKIGGRGWILQQDNASIHASRSTMEFLTRKNVRTLPWPARSPDLNPMQNLWAELSRRAYSHGRQYRIKQEL